MDSTLKLELDLLLASIPTHNDHRKFQETLDNLVIESLSRTNACTIPPAVRRMQWELCLRNDILELAATEEEALRDPQTNYYHLLSIRLDLILVMTEHDACDATFPLSVLEDVMETQTIDSCSYVFAWMEARSARLTKGMEPQRGKSLILLRTLNELLRRLSKTAQTTFCGRILTFLSGAYSLGDRSGVNLRGEYGPEWEGVRVLVEPKAAEMDVDENLPDDNVVEPTREVEMTESGNNKHQPNSLSNGIATVHDTNGQKREEFFQTFWSLQSAFSRPNSLTRQGALEAFQVAVNAVLPVISEANKKERLMMGSKNLVGNPSAKRKRGVVMEPSEDTAQDYFFAKFLTSPELLDLEIADSLFRRQILFQLLITLQHLQMFSKAEKSEWRAPRNRSLLVDFTLEPVDAKWITETWSKALNELRATSPFGKEFSDTVAVILQRERNWVSWKNDLCPSFDKMPVPSLEDATSEARQTKMMQMPSWKWHYGTEALTELFEMGYRDVGDLEDPPRYDDLPGLVKQIKIQDRRIDMRKRQLDLQAKKRADIATTQEQPTVTEVAAVDPTIPSREGITRNAILLSSSPKPPVATPGVHPLPPKPVTSVTSSNRTTVPSMASVEKLDAVEHNVPLKRAVALAPPRDRQLEVMEMTKRRLSWLALRVARTDHWQLFSGAKGNPEKMMWMLERNKESMKKPDEDSFALTGWVEGDTTMVTTPEKKVRAAQTADKTEPPPHKRSEGDNSSIIQTKQDIPNRSNDLNKGLTSDGSHGPNAMVLDPIPKQSETDAN